MMAWNDMYTQFSRNIQTMNEFCNGYTHNMKKFNELFDETRQNVNRMNEICVDSIKANQDIIFQSMQHNKRLHLCLES